MAPVMWLMACSRCSLLRCFRRLYSRRTASSEAWVAAALFCSLFF
eukprot:CAMPEP_0204345334 /NCGR_PEP_ID=MMETSP0469-20131031/26314_1 /ASSEMBLY_ACC=CAM_ASM_000384 /TAXON_ID=2969 /ORGANISM="Oxyrrhis marina" /LENGTH=44 /DNA_ID= /DNA_START= /DNA_END= /DNA_ORIENTATION=